jgi:conjugal transfer ATP-binding protein TraC
MNKNFENENDIDIEIVEEDDRGIFKRIKDYFTSPVEEYKKLLSRVDATKLLPYSFFDEEESMYINKDGSVGFIVDCGILSGINDQVFNGLYSALSFLPIGSVAQCILIASPDVTYLVDEWGKNKTNDGLLGEVKYSYTEFVESHTWNQISKSFNAVIRDFRLLITVKLGGKEEEYSILKGVIKKDEYSIEKEKIKQKIQNLKKARDSFLGSLKSARLAPIEVLPKGLVKILYPLINVSHDYRHVPKANNYDISNVLVNNDTIIEITDEFMKIDGYYAKSLAVKDFPEKFSLGNTMQFAGDVAGYKNFSIPFILCLNILKLKDKEKATIRKNASIVMSQRMPYALFPRLKYKHQDLSYGMEKIEKGESLYKVTFSVLLYAPDEEILAENVSGFISYYQSLGFRLEPDRYIHFPVFLSVLPFGYDRITANFLSRDRAVFGDNCVDMMPICSDWRGNKPILSLLSPRGQFVGFDLFSNDSGGYNAFVIGMTGSGKSVFLQYLALNYLMEDANIWIIDIGRSYERLAHVFDGDFIAFDLKNPMCLNPFSAIENIQMLEEYLEYLINLLLMMGSPREMVLAEQLEKLLRSYLERAIMKAYQKYGKETNIDSIIEMLIELNQSDNDSRITDFIRTMHPYSSKGYYGKVFNGKSELRFDKKLTVLENDTLEDMPDLRDPVLMVLTFHISKNIYLSHTGKKHIVIMDEAHKFLGNPHIDLFIEQAYRRFRKHGASMILGSQGFEDFYGGEQVSRAGRVIVQNSFWKFFLMQTETSRQAIYNSKFFAFNDYTKMLMDSVQSQPGEYSEIMILSDAATAKERLVLDKFLQAMFFTSPQVRQRIRELVDKEGKSYREAVEQLAQENVI